MIHDTESICISTILATANGAKPLPGLNWVWMNTPISTRQLYLDYIYGMHNKLTLQSERTGTCLLYSVITEGNV